MNDASTTRDRSRDTGLALVLLLLIAHLTTKRDGFTTAALVVLVTAMTVPLLFRPLSVVWFGFSHLLGSVMSKVLLAAVFFLVVTPDRRRPPAARPRLAAAAGVQARRRLGAAPARPRLRGRRPGEALLTMEFLRDLWGFLRQRKKFWLLPVIVALVGFGALIVLTSGSAIAPFIYTLF